MKKIKGKNTYILCIELILVIVLCLVVNYRYPNPFKGYGTSKNPYILSSSKDLEVLSQMINDGNEFDNKYFLQVCDIDMSNVDFEPIGIDNKEGFAGYYNGDGYKIKNIYYVSETNEDVGLFVSVSGVVSNVYLENCILGGNKVGGIAVELGEAGIIVNCYVQGSLEGWDVGPIVVDSKGKTENNFSMVIARANSVRRQKINKNYYYINNLSSNKEYGNIDSNTLYVLNEYVNANNNSLELNPWTVDNNTGNVVLEHLK